jgi:hypothetical protein
MSSQKRQYLQVEDAKYPQRALSWLVFLCPCRALCGFVQFRENYVILLVLPGRSKRIHVLLPHTEVKLTTS